MNADAARIVLHHVQGRTWAAWPVGHGAGHNWGCALAALDYHSHAHTDACPPTFYLDANAVRRVARDCRALGVTVVGGIGAVP